MRIAYLISQYPAVSHTFIRREIQAMERQGFEVLRISLRDPQSNLIDVEDLHEVSRTKFVLRQGMLAIFLATVRVLIDDPLGLMRTFVIACRMGFRAERSLPIHLIYVAEACLILLWLRAGRIQHVHAHFSTNTAEIALLVNALGGPPYSFVAHGVATLENPLFTALAEKIKKSKFSIGVCAYAKGQLLRFSHPADWFRVKVVHCGLEPSYFTIPAVPIPAKRRLVCVGRLCREKAQLLLLEAARQLAEGGIDFELVLAGDGEMRAVIDAKIVSYDLQTKVRVTGWLTSQQVQNEILAARALVLPSFAEGLPVVIMEAMALRRPIISTYVAGIPELVRPGEDGWLVPSGDVEALAEAMRACLDAPVDMLSCMGEAAHNRVSARHNVDTEASKLAKLIKM